MKIVICVFSSGALCIITICLSNDALTKKKKNGGDAGTTVYKTIISNVTFFSKNILPLKEIHASSV